MISFLAICTVLRRHISNKKTAPQGCRFSDSLPLRAVLALCIALDVTHPLFAVLFKPGEHIFKGHFRGFLPFLWFPDIRLAAPRRTGGMLTLRCAVTAAISVKRFSAAFSVACTAAITAAPALSLFRRFFCLFHRKADLALGIGADDFYAHLLTLCDKIADLIDIAPGDFRDMHHPNISLILLTLEVVKFVMYKVINDWQ